MTQRRDTFAEIAATRTENRTDELHIPAPPKIPAKKLPWAEDPESVSIVSVDRPKTANQLRAALESAKAKYGKYLVDCVPRLASHRTGTELISFDWRIEQPQDRTHIDGVFDGDGTWEQVTVPHYGEPIGKAATWYRTTFQAQPRQKGRRLFLHFDGVDYRAQVYVNRACVGCHEGFFAPFEFDITDWTRDGENLLLVRVENDYVFLGNDDPPSPDGTPGTEHQGDKLYAATGLGYDDPLHGWHHCPPGMGIYQPVRLEERSDLHVSDLFVRPEPELEQAEFWIEVTNATTVDRRIEIEYSVFGRNFEQTVVRSAQYIPEITEEHGIGDVDRGESRRIELLMGPGVNYLRFPVSIADPRLWNPSTPWMYEAQVVLLEQNSNEGKTIRDSATTQFGMRCFVIDESSEPKGEIRLNGNRIRLRGANTMGNYQQDVFRGDIDQLIDDILLAKLCNLNFLRITQRPVQRQIYEYCDRLGMMTQTDLPLFGVIRRNQFAEAIRQAGEMERLVRGHACNVLVSYINEAFPNARNQPHRHLQRHELDAWIEATDRHIRLHNPDRAIKPHDGDYDPPEPGLPDHHCYCGWYNGHGLGIGKLHRGYWQAVKRGWYYGCGEFGSEGLDPEPLMRSRYPKAWLPETESDEPAWSPNSIIKSQTGRYHHMWFDARHSLAGWVKASHAHQEFVTRLMTEAFRRDSRMVSYAIHLFIDAFPSGWMKAIMDVNRDPKPAWFAYRDACEPIMISLRTDRFAVSSGDLVEIEAWVSNDPDTPLQGAMLSYRFESDQGGKSAGEVGVEVEACGVACVGVLNTRAPRVAIRSACTVTASLQSSDGVVLDSKELEIIVFPDRVQTRGATPHQSRPRFLVASGDGAEGQTAEDQTTADRARTYKKPATRLAEELELPTIHHSAGDIDIGKNAEILIFDSISDYTHRSDLVDRAVEAGAMAVFLEIETGTHWIGGTEVTIEPTGMKDFFFASRNTSHSLVDGFEEHDFFMWYDPRCGYITPILSSTIRAEGWQTVVASGIVSWGADGGPAGAVIERTHGNGRYRVSQLSLAGRTINPVARIFSERLLGLV